MSNHEPTQNVIRLSFGWLVLAALVLVGLGVLGGVIGQQFTAQPLPPLQTDADQLFTTVHEVTISPNSARVELVQRAERSVMLVADTRTEAAVGTGTVVTNDGLLVTVGQPPRGGAIAFDASGHQLALELLGHDELYGLTFYRVSENVVVPLDLRRTAPAVAEELLAVSRNATSFTPRIDPFMVSEQRLTNAHEPGVQRVMISSQTLDLPQAGAPLVDDEGKLAGLVVRANGREALPIEVVRASIERVSTGQRESDPFGDIGLVTEYAFRSSAEQPVRFVAEVERVANASPAARAGLTVGDELLAINDEPLSLDQPLAEQLSQKVPLTLTILRNETEQQLTLTPTNQR